MYYDYYKHIFLKGIKSKKFFISILIILISMMFSLSGFFEDGMEYFFKHDYIMAFLQGYNGDKALLVAFAPLIATVPFAAQHVENRKSGTMKYMVVRMGYKQYFNSIFISNALISFATFFCGMISFMLISLLFFSRSLNMDSYHAITRVSIYASFAKISPLFYITVIVLHCSFVAIAYSSMGLALSYFFKNKFVAWLSPFILATTSSLFAMFLGLTKIEPMAIFDVSRVKGISMIFVFGYLLFTVGIAYLMSYKKFKKDIETDEEI